MPTADPYLEGLSDLGDVPNCLKEIEHFFQVYKDLEGTRTETRGFEGVRGKIGAAYGSRSDTGGPRISRHTIASRSCAGVYRLTAVWSAGSCRIRASNDL